MNVSRSLAYLIAGSWLGLGLSGCTVTDVGNPEDDTEEPTPVPLTIQLVEDPGGTSAVEIEKVWLVIEELRMIPDATCEDDDTIDFQGPFHFSIPGPAENKSSDDSITVPLRGSSFCSLTTRVTPLPVGELAATPPPGATGEAALLIKGTRISDGASVVAKTEAPTTLDLAPPYPITFDEKPEALILLIDTAQWFADSGIETTTLADDDPALLVDPSNNTGVHDKLTRMLSECITLHVDTNQNGVVDTDEPSLASGGLGYGTQ